MRFLRYKNLVNISVKALIKILDKIINFYRFKKQKKYRENLKWL